VLDPIGLNAAALKVEASMGRLNINTKMGDTDGDGDFDELVSWSPSFSHLEWKHWRNCIRQND
jgi:hypothetical protein